jgi:hypothetical protein
MWLAVLAVIALIIGNTVRKWGLEASRDNAYGSAAALAGQRASSVGTLINIAGGICLVIAIWSLL